MTTSGPPLLADSSPLMACDGSWVDWRDDTRLKGVDSGDFFAEFGMQSQDNKFRIANTSGSFGKRVDDDPFGIFNDYKDDTTFWVWWKRGTTSHHLKVNIIDCGANPCPNP